MTIEKKLLGECSTPCSGEITKLELEEWQGAKGPQVHLFIHFSGLVREDKNISVVDAISKIAERVFSPLNAGQVVTGMGYLSEDATEEKVSGGGSMLKGTRKSMSLTFSSAEIAKIPEFLGELQQAGLLNETDVRSAVKNLGLNKDRKSGETTRTARGGFTME